MHIRTKPPGRVKSALLRWLGVPITLADGDFWRAALAAESASGKVVTVNSSLQLSTVWACVNLLSRTVATLPLNVYRRRDDGGREVDRRIFVYRLVHLTPNADMTPATFWQVVMAHLLLWGNAFIEKRGPKDEPSSIVPLLPYEVQKKAKEGGGYVYIHNRNGKQREIPESRMIHIPALTMDGVLGLPPISCARQVFGAAMAADETSAKVFSNGLQVAGFFKMAGSLKDGQRDAFQKRLQGFVGSTNASKTMLLEEGMEYQQLTMKPEDAQMIATREFGIEEICRWFGVPPHMVGHTSKTTSWGSGLEQQNLGFLTYSLRPWLNQIEQAVTKDLLATSRDTHYAEFVVEGLLRADSAGRATLYASAAQNGWMTRAEIRSKENLPPIDGADELTAQSNLVPLNLLGAAGDSAGAREAMKNWLGITGEQREL